MIEPIELGKLYDEKTVIEIEKITEIAKRYSKIIEYVRNLGKLYDGKAVAEIVRAYSNILEHVGGLDSNDITTRRNSAESILLAADTYKEEVPQEIQDLLTRDRALIGLEKRARRILIGDRSISGLEKRVLKKLESKTVRTTENKTLEKIKKEAKRTLDRSGL